MSKSGMEEAAGEDPLASGILYYPDGTPYLAGKWVEENDTTEVVDGGVATGEESTFSGEVDLGIADGSEYSGD